MSSSQRLLFTNEAVHMFLLAKEEFYDSKNKAQMLDHAVDLVHCMLTDIGDIINLRKDGEFHNFLKKHFFYQTLPKIAANVGAEPSHFIYDFIDFYEVV